MATSGVLKIIKGKDEVYLYRCCDAFSDVMMELIEKTFKGFQIVTDNIDDYESLDIAHFLIAEIYIEAKAKNYSHICLRLWQEEKYPNFILDVSKRNEWKFTYEDYDEDDNELIITKIITKNGWVDEILNPSKRKQT